MDEQNDGGGHRMISGVIQASVGCLMILTCSGCVDVDNCDSTGGGHGASLSSAMHASASGSKEPLTGSSSGNYHSSEYQPAEACSAGLGGAAADAGISAGGGSAADDYDGDYQFQALLDAGYQVPFGGNIKAIEPITATPLSLEYANNLIGIDLGGAAVKLKPGSLPDQAITDPIMLRAGFVFRHYVNGPHTFLSPYLSGGLDYQYFMWNYRNPIEVDTGTITSDGLQGMTGYAGLGLAIARSKRLSVFGEADIGGTAFLSQTDQGFQNDVFANFGYLGVKAGLNLKF
jgi:hypothetical protein